MKKIQSPKDIVAYEWRKFIGSFTELKQKRFWSTLGLDLGCMASIFIILLAAFWSINTMMPMPDPQLNPDNIYSIPVEEFDQQNEEIQRFIVLSTIIFFTALALMIASIFVFRYLVWSILMRQRFKLKRFFKFIPFMIIWYIILLIVGVIPALLIQQLVRMATISTQALFPMLISIPALFVLMVLFFFLVHMTNVAFSYFMLENKILLTLKKTLLSLSMIKSFILPYLFIAFAFIATDLVGRLFMALVQNWGPAFFALGTFISTLLLFMWLAWERIYAVSIITQRLD